MNTREFRAHEPAESPPESRRPSGQAEAAMHAQRAELARMMSELRALQDSIKQQQGIDVRVLRQENEELRALLKEYESAARARQEEETKQTEATDPAAPADGMSKIEELRTDNELLRLLLEEKEAEVARLRQRIDERNAGSGASAEIAPEASPEDLESMETELNRHRRQLEVDRAKLTREIEQLRVRNEELDEATREMEMAMSKERAELARERIRLDRMREEVRNDIERAQRDGGMRDSLASVNKLRGSFVGKKE